MSLCNKNCVPDACSLAFVPEPTQRELTLVDVPKQFDTGDDFGGECITLEDERGTGSGLDTTMVLLDHVVQIHGGPQVCASGSSPSSRYSQAARCDAA